MKTSAGLCLLAWMAMSPVASGREKLSKTAVLPLSPASSDQEMFEGQSLVEPETSEAVRPVRQQQKPW